MSTPSKFVDAILSELGDGTIELEDYRGNAAYSYNAFWMNMPEVKRDYRISEHLLQAAEMMATDVSLTKDSEYPSQAFYGSWIQMMINMDRNVLWGAGSGSPFYDSHHWNTWDRFESVQKQARETLNVGMQSLTSEGESVTLFNPLNWERKDPVVVTLPPDRHLDGASCESRPGTDDAVCVFDQPSTGLISFPLSKGSAGGAVEVEFQPEIKTDIYIARFDPKNGSLVSLRDRVTGKEYLAGPANVVQAESVEGIVKDPTNWMAPRPMRKLADSTSRREANFQVFRGPLSVTVIARSGFAGGSRVERRVTFYHKYPRIDFETTVNMRARNLVVTTDFPLAGTVTERTRGIPFGFSAVNPRKVQPPNPYFLMSDHKTYGFSAAIQPAVRWSDYSLDGGGGIALLDRGLSCHELNDNTVTLALVNAQDYYRGLDNILLTGQGVRTLQYALWPHTGNWREVEIPRRAWEYNSPVIMSEGREVQFSKSIVSTSDNLIVQVVRRIEGEIEVRLAEWAGRGGNAEVKLNLPHQDARMTNMMGENSNALEASGGAYRFKVRPQQIVTLRFRADSSVERPKAIRSWTPLVPWFKRGPLEVTDPVRGYPPITRQPTADDFGVKTDDQ
jgi:alpha-mannosidase